MQALLSVSYLRVQDLPPPFQKMREIIFKDRKDDSSIRKATLTVFNSLNDMLNNKLTLGQQEDSHEFISWFFGLKESAALQKYFEIGSKQTTMCGTMNCYKNTTEQCALQIFVRPNTKIQECITTSTDFKENREYKCKTCSALEGTFSTYVTKPPAVLMLFTELFDSLTNAKTKYDKSYKAFENYVSLPMFQGSNLHYKLKSFITHTGNMRNFGHYKAYIRTESGWLCCDDSLVTNVSGPKLCHDEHVYVQFYERQ